MKKTIALICALAMLFALGLTAHAAEKPELGDAFMDFTVRTIDGETFTLSEALRDHDAVVVNLFATWCGPCKMEFPELDAVAGRYADRVATIAISVEPKDTAEKLLDFREQLGISLPMATLPDYDLGGYVHGKPSYSIPTTVVIDRFGSMVFMQVGAFRNAEQCERVYAMTLGDDYTETRVWTELPAPAPRQPFPDDAALSDALNAGGSDLAFVSARGEGMFPFVVKDAYGRHAAFAGNTAIADTRAAFSAEFTAEADGTVEWEMLYGGEAGRCVLSVRLDGAPVKVLAADAGDWLRWAVPVSAGAHTLTVACDSVRDGDDEFDLGVDDVRLLYGDEAAAALNALPAYPVADATAIVPEGGRRAVVTVDEYALNVDVYVLSGETARVRIDADASVDPHGALVYCMGPDINTEALLCDIHDTAVGEYYVEFPMAGLADDHLYGVSIITDCISGDMADVLLVNDEAYIDELLDYYRPQAPDMEWGWHYAEEEAPEDAETEAAYTIRVVDQDGHGVPGAYVNVCTDETCEPRQTDDDGVITYVGAPQVYHLQLLTAPEGYALGEQTELYTEAQSGEYTFEVTRN